MNKNIYLFYHISKTAGTSMRKMLHQNFSDDLVYEYYHPQTRPFVESEKSQRAKYFIGHLVYYGMHEQIKTDNNSQYVLFLRDPFTRYESLYNYIRMTNMMDNHIELSFEEWFQSYQSDTMCSELTLGISPFLENAIKILEKSSFIGLKETFSEDVSKIFWPGVGICRVNIIEHLSQASQMDPVRFTDSQRELIRGIIKDDIILYEYALKLRKSGHNNSFQSITRSI